MALRVLQNISHFEIAGAEGACGCLLRLKKHGKCFTTFFVLNDESMNLLHSGGSTLDLKYETEGCLTTDEAIPESAIAYHEGYIRGLFERHGLTISQPIDYGAWCGRQVFLTYQDLLIAERRGRQRQYWLSRTP